MDTSLADLPGVSDLMPLCDRCGEEINPGEEKEGTGEWDGYTLCSLCFEDVQFEQREEVPF